MSQSRAERAAENKRRTLEAIERLTARGETDAMGGGVPTVRLAAELDMTKGAVKTYLEKLRDEGAIKQVDGRGPKMVRPSYLPTDEPADADGFGTARLREGETRDDDNTHARRNEIMKRRAERELGDGEREVRTDGGEDEPIVRVEIKETRHGNLAVRSEVDGPSGLRGPTDAERKASELHNKILDRIDESEYSSGDVIADIHVPRSGDPWIDWNDDVVGAAGNDPHVATDGGRPSDGTEHVEWWEKASNNVQKWGLQDVPTLLLAMQEEMGELAQAHLEARDEDGDPDRVESELADLAALCFQLQWALNERTEADSR